MAHRMTLAALALAVAGILGCEAHAAAAACDPDDGGLRLPPGFCARVVADDAGGVRNLVVAPNGDLFAARRASGGGGGVLALRDGDGDGRAEQRAVFGRGDGHGIALTATHLYYAAHDEVVRWPYQAGRLEPAGEAETLVTGFPEQDEHHVKALALGADGALFVEVGAPSNACQEKPRSPRVPGLDPCPQRTLQAGIWRYRADQAGQRHRAEARFASGLRHALGLAVHPATGELWAAVNGRDMLSALWGFSDQQNAELPAEEFVRVSEGADLGWPYCYHDGRAGRGRKVLAPEYGGDGDEVGRCAEAALPEVAFPAHWAPMAVAFYDGELFPARFRGGAFVAFRGSWNRAPLPQEGYRVSFVPFVAGRPSGEPETFAIGADDPTGLRMTGVAVGPDGALFVAAGPNGRIWRIQPEPEAAPAGAQAAPSAQAAPGD